MIYNARLLLIILLLNGCSALSLVNAVSPDRHYKLEHDLEYGLHPRQQLDLAIPLDTRPTALIIFFYGGAWTSGERQGYRFVIDAFAKAGFAVAIPDYRLYPEVRFRLSLRTLREPWLASATCRRTGC